MTQGRRAPMRTLGNTPVFTSSTELKNRVRSQKGTGLQDTETLPAEFTWSPHSLCRKDNMGMDANELDKVRNMSSVPDQKGCGCCWAISTVGAIADNLLVAGVAPNNKRPELSATYALMGGNGKCVKGDSVSEACDDPDNSVTWQQKQCKGGRPGDLLNMVARYGIPETFCADYSWCDNDADCSTGENSSDSDLSTLIPPLKNNSSTCYASTMQPFYKIQYDVDSSDKHKSTGITSINSNPSSDAYFMMTCEHIRSNGPVIGGFQLLQNFYSGACAYSSYMDGDVKKPTPWKGIYLEQIDYPNDDDIHAPDPKYKIDPRTNMPQGSNWGNCLVGTRLADVSDFYSNPHTNDQRFVLSDMYTELVKIKDGCSAEWKNAFQIMTYDDTKYPSGIYNPYGKVGGHAAVIMGWGADYIDWPICSSGAAWTKECRGEYCRKLVRFWYVRNSWTPGWGDSGYCKIAWYVSDSDRQKNYLGNVYSQFDCSFISSKTFDMPHGSCSNILEIGGSMNLISGVDQHGDVMAPTFADVEDLNYGGPLNHKRSWYGSQEPTSTVRFAGYSPLPNDPSMCIGNAGDSPHIPPIAKRTDHSGHRGPSGSGNNPGGGNLPSGGGSSRNRRGMDNKRSQDGKITKRKRAIAIGFCVSATIIVILLCVVVAN